jgi:integrase
VREKGAPSANALHGIEGLCEKTSKKVRSLMKRDGLYRRENGIFAFRYKDKARCWKEKYTGTADRADALKAKQNFLKQLSDGTLPTDKAEWTVEEAATRWVEDHAAHLNSEKAKRNEKSLLRQLTNHLGSRKVNSITLDQLKEYQRERGKKVGERAINLELRILISVLKEANLWAPIGAHYKPLKERESDIGRALSVEELRRLEIAAQNPAWLVAYNAEILAANTGLRGGEIKRLQLGDINLETRRLRIRRAGTKTDAGARLIELNQAATQAATRLYMRAQTLGASEPDDYLLPAELSRHTKKEDPLKGGIGFDVTRHQNSWRSAWRSLLKAGGLQGLRFHDLRHSFISFMAERGVPLPIVQSMVGHMSARMTRYYTHISSQAARQAVELLDQPRLVGNFVGKPESNPKDAPKLLN